MNKETKQQSLKNHNKQIHKQVKSTQKPIGVLRFTKAVMKRRRRSGRWWGAAGADEEEQRPRELAVGAVVGAAEGETWWIS